MTGGRGKQRLHSRRKRIQLWGLRRPARTSGHRMTGDGAAAVSPALRARCATTASVSALPKQATRYRSSPRRPRARRRRSSRRCARCSARRIPIGSVSTRFSTPFGAAAACVSGKSFRARRARATRRRAGSPKRACRRRRSAFPIMSSGAVMATAKPGRRPRPPRRRLARRIPVGDRSPPHRRSRRRRRDPRAGGAACPHHAGAAYSPRADPPPRAPA